MESVCCVTRRDVFAEGFVGVAFDGDLVVVVDDDEFAELERAREGCGFGSDAFHHVAVGADGEGAVVDDFVSGPVVSVGEDLFGECETDGVAEALAEWTGGSFDAGSEAEFRVTGRLAFPLSEVFDLVEREVVAGEVEHRV